MEVQKGSANGPRSHSQEVAILGLEPGWDRYGPGAACDGALGGAEEAAQAWTDWGEK